MLILAERIMAVVGLLSGTQTCFFEGPVGYLTEEPIISLYIVFVCFTGWHRWMLRSESFTLTCEST